MLSIFFDGHEVYYSFDDILRCMITLNFDQVDKKILACDRLCIVNGSEQVFCTDGSSIDVRLVMYDECFVTSEGLYDLMDVNVFGDKEKLEEYVVRCTMRVVKNENHDWYKKYIKKLKDRIGASFDLYFRTLERYMLHDHPNADKIAHTVNCLITTAEYDKLSNNHVNLRNAYNCFDKASALMIQQMNE